MYYPLATIKGENGLLYFGGAGGLTIVNPEKVRFNPVKPKAVISDFYIDNTSVLGKRKASLNADFANNTPQLVLSHKEQNFGFKISSDNYLNANKNQFRYRLKNFDNRWILADASVRIIHYSKIPPGNYFFEFQTANNDGIWGDISSVKIIRKRAPWFSIPAVLLYFFLFSAMVYYLVSTYKKRKQLELQHYLDQIEKEKKEEIHKNQLQFFTNISHDLKTPLSLIMATVNRMREEGMKEYYYKILNNNSERLMQMLSEILDFRKIQNNKMKLKVSNGNLNEFLQVVSSGFHEYAANKSIDFQIKNTDDSLVEIPFDKKIMEKIVLNLLNNAFKYTQKGGTIKITASQQEFDSEYSTSFTIENKSIPPSNSFFQLTVSDTGVGISKESIVKVFDRFYRVETKNESAHLGTGIGLALVKDLVLLHKGSITICSERNIGTDFILRFSMLPSYYRPDEIWIAEESVAVQQEHQTGFSSDSSTSVPVVENKSQSINEFKHIEKSISKKTILIAEDNIDLKAIIKFLLEEKYTVIDFEDAKPAIEFLKKEDVDLIISDIMMPEVDGITFCKSIKSNVETSHIPFMLLTAKSGGESMLEGTESGADLYLQKPINLSLLKAAIANIFKQQEVLREYYAKNYFANISEITTNKADHRFLIGLTKVINEHLDESELDVNTIASEMMMSRSKLYSKVKTLTGKSVVEFVLNYRLRRAAKLLTEDNISIQEAMFSVGIESQSYFTNAFKKEFGLPPSKFVAQNKKGNRSR